MGSTLYYASPRASVGTKSKVSTITKKSSCVAFVAGPNEKGYSTVPTDSSTVMDSWKNKSCNPFKEGINIAMVCGLLTYDHH